ncbi:MAG: hypothetical protein PHE62_06970 [Acidobacteriota bacterium]|nr:hypothetical protein [Acidobacteriota bacterium]
MVRLIGCYCDHEGDFPAIAGGLGVLSDTGFPRAHFFIKNHLLEDLFRLRERRTVNSGYPIIWRNRTFVPRQSAMTLRKADIIAREGFDGRPSFRYQGKESEHKKIEIKLPPPVFPVVIVKTPRKISISMPSPTHPETRVCFFHRPD